jgi:hypothetical protein
MLLRYQKNDASERARGLEIISRNKKQKNFYG